MPELLSIRRVARSRPVVFWAYAAVSFLLLLVLMYLIADRATQPQSTPALVETSVVEGSVPAAVDNEFVPTDRDISECISAIPKPGCGSEARSGWRQTLVFLAIVGGLGLIAWRVVAGARKARRVDAPTA